MTFEDQVELAMRTEALQVHPPVSDLVAGGIARGRDLRRRRRARLAVGGAAAVLAAAAGTVVAVPFLTGDDGGHGPVASGDDGGADTVAAPPQADPVAEIDPDAVLDAVTALLPPGEITETSADAVDASSAWFAFVYDDGGGASWFHGTVGVAPVAESPGCPVLVNGGGCEESTLDDGTVLLLQSGPYYPQPDREPGRLLWSATATAPSGSTVYLAEMNTPTEKDSEPTRDEPPLPVDRLAAIVTDGVWAELTEGVAPPEQPEVQDDPPEVVDAARTLAELLGPGWTPGDGVSALPGPDATAGLPDGAVAGPAELMLIGAELSVERHCEPMEEKGRITEPCTTTTTPDGETVHVQWATTALDGPYAQTGYYAEVMVIAGTDAQKARVSLMVSDTADATTPERRDAIADWLAGHVDDLARAAVAGNEGEPR